MLYALLGLLMLSACGTAHNGSQVQEHRPEVQQLRGLRQWDAFELPGKKPTVFTFLNHDGRDAVLADSRSSASMLRQRLQVDANELGKLRFSWKVPQLIERADMGVRELDDSPVRVILVFGGDRSQFSMKNAMLSELSLAMTGEPLPYATLMYVWCNTRAPGSVVINPRSDRIRKLVLESGAGELGHWLDYERDIRKDFERVFGEPAGPLLGLAIMTDTDNTRSEAQAWYGPLSLTTARD